MLLYMIHVSRRSEVPLYLYLAFRKYFDQRCCPTPATDHGQVVENLQNVVFKTL